MGPLAGNFDNHTTTITPPLTMMTGLLHFGNVTTTLAGPLYSFTSDNTTSTQAGPRNLATDHHGALMFIVATVVVYGLSIVFFICGHTQKRELTKDEERQISSYLKRLYLDEASKDVRKFHILRLKSQMLVDSALGQRHNRRISLLPGPLEPWKRFPQDEGSENGSSDDDDDDKGGDLQGKKKKASTPLFKDECTVQTVNELEIPPSVPFRGRRFACVGFYRGSVFGSRESLHDGHVSRGLSSQQRAPLHAHSLSGIKENEIFVHSTNDDMPSNEKQQQQQQQQQHQQQEDPSEIPSSTPDLVAEDPHDHLNFSAPWVLSSAPGGSRLAGPNDDVLCSSRSTQELNVVESIRGDSVESLQQQMKELMPMGSVGSVMVTRL